MNKKGSARDNILFVVIMFSLAIGLFASYFIVNESADEILAVSSFNESAKAVESIEAMKEGTERFDSIIFTTFIGLSIGIIILGWVVGGNSVFMFLYFLFVMIGVVLATIFANVWYDFSQSSIFGLTLLSFPITNNLILYMPIYISVVGLLGLIAMFTKPYMIQSE